MQEAGPASPGGAHSPSARSAQALPHTPTAAQHTTAAPLTRHAAASMCARPGSLDKGVASAPARSLPPLNTLERHWVSFAVCSALPRQLRPPTTDPCPPFRIPHPLMAANTLLCRRANALRPASTQHAASPFCPPSTPPPAAPMLGLCSPASDAPTGYPRLTLVHPPAFILKTYRSCAGMFPRARPALRPPPCNPATSDAPRLCAALAPGRPPRARATAPRRSPGSLRPNARSGRCEAPLERQPDLQANAEKAGGVVGCAPRHRLLRLADRSRDGA